MQALVGSSHPAPLIGIRASLMKALIAHITAWNISQLEVAERLGLSPSRVDTLLTGKTYLFSLDGLMRIADKAGLTISFSVEE
jgi:predicted XRE-type DNA-binding protein